MPNKPTLHFAHANGFPAGSYRQLFEALEDDFNIIAIERMGHDPRYPINNNWSNVADELINYIEQNANTPVIGIGHSMGAIASFLAAYKRPELFKQLIMMDPPLAMSYGAASLWVSKKLGLMDRITPAGKSQYRRTQWDNRQACFDNLRPKGLFQEFSDDALWDYINSATDLNTDGTATLNYTVAAECTAFRTLPNHLEFLRKPLAIPATLIRGQRSEVLHPHFARRLANIHKMQQLETEGGHMFPLQRPEATAAIIRSSRVY